MATNLFNHSSSLRAVNMNDTELIPDASGTARFNIKKKDGSGSKILPVNKNDFSVTVDSGISASDIVNNLQAGNLIDENELKNNNTIAVKNTVALKKDLGIVSACNSYHTFWGTETKEFQTMCDFILGVAPHFNNTDFLYVDWGSYNGVAQSMSVVGIITPNGQPKLIYRTASGNPPFTITVDIITIHFLKRENRTSTFKITTSIECGIDCYIGNLDNVL